MGHKLTAVPNCTLVSKRCQCSYHPSSTQSKHPPPGVKIGGSWRFHVDRVGVRMLVTYTGPGTQWLPHEHVDRRWLGSAGQDRPDEENGLMKSGAEVQQVNPFDVVLLKGEAWPGAERFGAVHRSPDPLGEPRVLLRVDMLSQAPGASEEVSS